MMDKFAASFLINSALYIAMVFAAGLVWDKHIACLLAIATAATALAAADFVDQWKRATLVAAALSWFLGLAAALALVF